jgi:hypothetical protein
MKRLSKPRTIGWLFLACLAAFAVGALSTFAAHAQSPKSNVATITPGYVIRLPASRAEPAIEQGQARAPLTPEQC